MAKLTLLEITQDILSALDGDEVDSVWDTEDSLKVANIIRDCYEDIAAELDLGHQGELRRLEDAGNIDQPVLLRIPDNVQQIDWINYGVLGSSAPDPEPDLEGG